MISLGYLAYCGHDHSGANRGCRLTDQAFEISFRRGCIRLTSILYRICIDTFRLCIDSVSRYITTASRLHRDRITTESRVCVYKSLQINVSLHYLQIATSSQTADALQKTAALYGYTRRFLPTLEREIETALNVNYYVIEEHIDR